TTRIRRRSARPPIIPRSWWPAGSSPTVRQPQKTPARGGGSVYFLNKKKNERGKVKGADLVDPPIQLADEGFVLDESLPTTIAEGRRFLEKYPESAKIFLPGGKVPRPGHRFVKKYYPNTLRAIARDGAETFYRGEIARKIAADLEEQGGIIGFA